VEDVYTRVVGGDAVSEFSCTVRGTVIDDEYFQTFVLGQDFGHDQRKIFGLIICGQDDDGASHDGSKQGSYSVSGLSIESIPSGW
jgi:hypothetical protein